MSPVKRPKIKAVSLAESHYPIDRTPTDPEAARAFLTEREKVYKSANEEGSEVIEHYGVDAARLDAIEEEGERENWPRSGWAVGRTGAHPCVWSRPYNESGRLLMSDEEAAARRDAAIRALAAIRGITDETDTDKVWADVLRGLEGAS